MCINMCNPSNYEYGIFLLENGQIISNRLLSFSLDLTPCLLSFIFFRVTPALEYVGQKHKL